MIQLSPQKRNTRKGVATSHRAVSAALAVALVATMTMLPARPAEAATVAQQIPVTYGQTEARSMLAMINAFRASNAKCWNSANTAQVAVGKQPALAYDYELEKVAMLRAAEIAVSYGHDRPDGTDCFTAFPAAPLYACGENIAAGYGTANAVFVGWREDNEKYQGQGHRRNMLNPAFTAVGIGHVTLGGTHYWVQNFGAPGTGAAATPAVDGARTVSVVIDEGKITSRSLASSARALAVAKGKSVGLPKVAMAMAVRDNWPTGKLSFAASNPAWKSSNPAVATVSGQRVIGKKAGKATLAARVNGLSVRVPITVVQPQATALSSVKGAKKSLKIRWKKRAKYVTGYQVQCSTSKKFTKKTTVTKTVKKAKTTSLSVKKLKAKKTYYVKVRTYYKDKATGKTFYSSWSKVKKAKTKR